jgi:DNA sulfur modification protein DndB
MFRLHVGGTAVVRNMTEYLGNLVCDSEEIARLLRLRKPAFIYQTVPHDKVEFHEAEGWTIDKKNKSSTRLCKPKPSHDKLEDDVWALAARMGFKELNADRQFTVHVGKDINPRQIDVFAKDDETLLLIECTGCETPTKKNMSGLIEKIQSIRPNALKSINKHYDNRVKLKVRWVIVTRNVLWGDADLAKAKAARISVIRDQELQYYNQLTNQLKYAARYQLLADLFASEEIHSLDLRVPATRGKMGKKVFYNFLIQPSELLKISYISHKASHDAEALGTYQRMLQSSRLKNIATYINDGGVFPTNVVINIESKSPLRFDKKENIGDSSFGTLYLPNRYAAAWVIDGQHRLYGYAFSERAEKSTLPVLAFENLPVTEQARLFVDINHEQVRVSKNLLIELFADLHWDSEDPQVQLYALASRVIKILETSPISPIYQRIITTGKAKDARRCLTLTTLAEGLRKINLFGEMRNGHFQPGALYFNDRNKSLKKASSFLSEYFNLFAKNNPENWELGDAPGGYLCTNNAIVALLRILKAVCEYIDQKNTVRCDELTSEELIQEVTPLIQPILTYLKSASADDLKLLRGQLGDKGQRTQALALMVFIHEKYTNFNPAGLQEYLDSWDEKGTEEGRTIVHEVQLKLFNGVVAKLRQAFPNKEDWWVEGIPLKVRNECVSRREQDPDRLDPEQYLDLIDYKSIAAQNWELFKDEFSLEEKGGKEAQLKWIQQLNTIRNKISHPERGMITKDELAFLRDVGSKMEFKFQDEANAA